MMNAFKGLLLVALTLATVGCGGGTPGGPGTPTKDKKPMVGQADETFTLDVPLLATSVKQGETKQVAIDIKRGKDFVEDVNLSFEAPKGITLDPASPAIKKGDTGTKFSIKAADDAPVGKFTVKVKGTPTKGSPASNEFTVSVDKK